jgi:hypothetical protein
MTLLVLVLHFLWLPASVGSAHGSFERVFEQAATFDQFVSRVRSQRQLWDRAHDAEIPADLSTRLRRVAGGMRILVVAEDWCIDSANTVPLVGRLAEAAGVELRVVDRALGRPLLEGYRTADGRTATPLIVLLSGTGESRAWVERPAPLQRLFGALITSPDALRALTDRQRWYDQDGGRTALEEIVRLAEKPDAR